MGNAPSQSVSLARRAGRVLSHAAGRTLTAVGSGVAAVGRRFQYDAVESRGRRRSPGVNHHSEDGILTRPKRSRLQANTRDLMRNFSIAAWAVRRHLDYVATFEFDAQNSDRGLNRELTDFFWQVAAPAQRFDVAGRMSWSNGIRMLERQAVTGGDVGFMLLNDGSVQGIETDRVRDPDKADKATGGRWVQGVKINDAGRHLAYAIHTRKGNGFEFARTVPAGNMVWHGYYDRFGGDQVRGVSPIVSALNPLRDVYENFDYALARSKVDQLFGLKFTRNADKSAGELMPGSGETYTDAEGQTRSKPYEVNFGLGPVVLDLDPGDDAAFLSSQNPSSQFQDYMALSIAVALKALDIPFSFFDESHTNFFGSRGAWLHYERACEAKREPLQDAQDRLFIRRLMVAIRDGEFELPRGKTIGDLRWGFVPRGVPWWKPSEEVRGDREAVLGGFENPESICRKRGTPDPYENIDRTAAVLEYARSKGVTLDYQVGPAPMLTPTGKPADDGTGDDETVDETTKPTEENDA